MKGDIDCSDMRHSWSILSWKLQLRFPFYYEEIHTVLTLIRRFSIHWIEKQFVPIDKFSFLRVKHNKRSQNESALLVFLLKMAQSSYTRNQTSLGEL